MVLSSLVLFSIGFVSGLDTSHCPPHAPDHETGFLHDG